MKIAVLGTGMVGRAHGARLVELGYKVVIGTRNVEATLARTQPDTMGNPPFRTWLNAHPEVALATFAAAAAQAELVINATNGSSSLEALEAAGRANLHGKTVIDVSNPLDFSHGMPPRLMVCNDDSLGEQLQRAFPDAHIVKTLSTVTADVMVYPENLARGDHTVFVSGNDANAKAEVSALLQSYGWTDIFDLGDISTARGPEMYFALWIRAFQALGSAQFNVKLVR